MGLGPLDATCLCCICMLHITNLKSNLKKEKQFFFSVHQLIQSYIPIPILARNDSGKLPTTVQNLQCNLYLPAVNVTYVYIHLYQGSYNIYKLLFIIQFNTNVIYVAVGDENIIFSTNISFN